ncbi:PfkB family carbohydrate kinase [Marinitoga lauensis]|uniref:PfkB family carbohydrate kinase n=1 Tax=Marinitoga lauensis TaxID=2201189 RepID=UPI0010101345|nr:PfkB family carbohydrate kinase [Marinitoga lauensis]
MNIDVYGALFYDIYIYGEKPHESQIIEIPGGSGFNIAYLLYKLGYNISFNGFIGNDLKGKYLKDIIPFKNIQVKEKKTATFISKNDIPLV